MSAVPALLVLPALPALPAAPALLAPVGWAPPATALLAFLLLVGWGLAGWGLAQRRGARRGMARVARAEHELRGPVAVLRLTCDRMSREPAGRRYARSLEVEIERLSAGLTDLHAARTGRRTPGAEVALLAAVPQASGREAAGAAPGERVAEGDPGGRAAPRGHAGHAGQADDLEAFAGGALAGWRPVLRAAGRRMRLDWKAGRVALPRDRGRVAQALGNLVANAAEHGAGEVELRGRRIPGGVRIEVRNRLRPGRPAPGADGRPPASSAGSRAKGPERGADGRREDGRGDDRGHGLSIAAAAARELGGSVETSRDDRTFTAALELPLSAASIRMRERLAEQGTTRRAGPRRPRNWAAMPSAQPRKGPTRPPGVPPGGPRPQPRPPAKPPRVNRPPAPSRRNTNARRM